MSELESLHRVVLRRHQAIASQERAHISPLQAISIAHDNDWDLEGHCKDQLDEIQGLIAGGTLIVGFQRWGSSR
ncbi:hypothetical protein M407DRAFT_245069 [Tulasnella calospora MUT 4182]|uniref:Uncharacterized protein n=1 Tax=Tulasnella calospora MUT 4182 TaxID=1051891 RepID=A0A0C3KMS3_9AGAM|nr:hypothetical protein M407DRAFT_245069 [Tulasnella calospora MUT 4182]